MQVKNFFYVLAIWLCCDCVHGKVIVNSQLWQAATNIYYISQQASDKLEIYNFTPTDDLQGLTDPTIISIHLPNEIAAVADVALCNTGQLLLVLTADEKFFIIDLNTKQIKLSLQLRDYLAADDESPAKYILAADNRSNLLALINTAKPSVLLLQDWQHVPADNIATAIKIIPAPPTVSKIITKAQVLRTQDRIVFFTGVQTADGYAIWELDMLSGTTQRLHQLQKTAIQDLILLATKQPQELDAFVISARDSFSFLPYATKEQHLSLPVGIIMAKNIQQLIVGPAITLPVCSWYLLEELASGSYISSNNFAAKVAVVANAKVFLKHGELVFFSPTDDKVFSIEAATGKNRTLTTLNSQQLSFPVALPKEQADFLLWDPQHKKHVFFCLRGHKIYLRHVRLAFDKPKALSWRLQDPS